MRAVTFVGPSGAGKTTLIESLCPILRRARRSVGFLKSDAHSFEMDHEGKDTDRVFRAGAERVAIASATEGALRFRLDRKDPMRLLEELFPACDLVLVEGFKASPLPKIEVRRDAAVPPVISASDATLLAVVSPFPDPRPPPRFDPGDVEGIARFLLAWARESVGRRPANR
ncbi:MAG: molybdopterin-guanine dinucleotide biosynthesis protein B [Planctomycetaceae bacterium]